MADVATPTTSEAASTRTERMTVRDPRKVQLYSAATANGIKVAAALEEIKVARARKGDDFDYEPHTVRIRHGESRMDFFKEMNPHGRFPLWFTRASPSLRVEPSSCTLQRGSTTYCPLCIMAPASSSATRPSRGSSGRALSSRARSSSSGTISSTAPSASLSLWYVNLHFTHSHTQLTNYPFIHSSLSQQQRSTEKVKRHLAALESQLASHHSMFPRGEHYIAGMHYSIADLAIWPWLWALFEVYDNVVTMCFDGFNAYPNVLAYKDRCLARPASRKALEVCQLGDD